jgi:hypothetical protein
MKSSCDQWRGESARPRFLGGLWRREDAAGETAYRDASIQWIAAQRRRHRGARRTLCTASNTVGSARLWERQHDQRGVVQSLWLCVGSRTATCDVMQNRT